MSPRLCPIKLSIELVKQDGVVYEDEGFFIPEKAGGVKKDDASKRSSFAKFKVYVSSYLLIKSFLIWKSHEWTVKEFGNIWLQN